MGMVYTDNISMVYMFVMLSKLRNDEAAEAACAWDKTYCSSKESRNVQQQSNRETQLDHGPNTTQVPLPSAGPGPRGRCGCIGLMCISLYIITTAAATSIIMIIIMIIIIINNNNIIIIIICVFQYMYL